MCVCVCVTHAFTFVCAADDLIRALVTRLLKPVAMESSVEHAVCHVMCGLEAAHATAVLRH